MSRKTELAKNTAILTVGKLCTQCISFFLLPLYTAILTTSEYGTFDLFMTYATLLIPLVNWQFDQGLFRFMLDIRGDEEKQRALFTTLAASGVVQCAVYTAVYLAVMPLLKLTDSYFLLIYVVAQVFIALLLQFVRGLGSSVKYTVASFISAAATMILNVVTLAVLRMGLRGLYVSTLIAQLLTLLYLIAGSRCWRYFSLRQADRRLLKTVAAYSIPLIPNNLGWWVVNASDRTVISWAVGVAANGIYTVANKFPHVFISFYNILNLSWTETVSLHFFDEDRDEFLSETMTQLFRMFSAGCFGIIALMPFVFPILVNAKFADAYNHILILMFAMLFRVLVGLYSCVYVAEKKAGKIAATTLIAAAINLSVDLLLIRSIQVYAASLSTLAAFLSMFIVRYLDINKNVCLRIEAGTRNRAVAVGALLCATYYTENLYLHLAALAAAAAYAIHENLPLVGSGVRLVKKKLGRGE